MQEFIKARKYLENLSKPDVCNMKTTKHLLNLGIIFTKWASRITQTVEGAIMLQKRLSTCYGGAIH